MLIALLAYPSLYPHSLTAPSVRPSVCLSVQSEPGAIVLLAAGDRLILRRTFTATDAQSFAHLSGDTNPLHAHTAAAQQSAFGQPVVPGMLTASLFSAVFGSTLPGSVYVRQEVHFVRPLMFEVEVEAAVTISSITPRRGKHASSQTAATEQQTVGSEAGRQQQQQQPRDESFAALVECATEVSRVKDGKLLIKGSASVIVPRCQLR